jgi:hypothetical protein
MKRHTIIQILLMMLIASVSVMALGGGGSKSPPEDDTVRVTMKAVNEDDTNIYGWIRITPDKFAVGANRLEPKTYYAVYLENSETRKAMTDKPSRRSYDDGEFKFETRLKEPFGGEWDKVVLYRRPNGKEDAAGEVAVLEGTLE